VGRERESHTEFAGGLDRFEALAGVFGQRLRVRNQQIGVRLPMRPPDAAAQLV
jgi:hypothetical protein